MHDEVINFTRESAAASYRSNRGNPLFRFPTPPKICCDMAKHMQLWPEIIENGNSIPFDLAYIIFTIDYRQAIEAMKGKLGYTGFDKPQLDEVRRQILFNVIRSNELIPTGSLSTQALRPIIQALYQQQNDKLTLFSALSQASTLLTRLRHCQFSPSGHTAAIIIDPSIRPAGETTQYWITPPCIKQIQTPFSPITSGPGFNEPNITILTTAIGELQLQNSSQKADQS